MSFEDAAPHIAGILTDVDGVLTDGRIVYGSDGKESKSFHVRDGLAIKLWMQSGLRLGIITARTSEMVTRRAAELGVEDLVQNASNKWEAAQRIMDRWGLQPRQVAYVGDDLPDLPVMMRVGLAVAPSDAATDVCDLATLVLRSAGGNGAIRELVERLMKSSGRWQSHVPSLGDPIINPVDGRSC